ncbi:MAG: orotidine-5'-phosphate decarboxylase [Hyphomicrobiaceae bacterium]
MSKPTPRDRLIVALDVPSVDLARGLVSTLGDHVTFYKIGLELVMNGGLPFVGELADRGKRIFLDLKLLDIPNTITRAVANAAELGATFLTVHGTDLKTLEAAVAGRHGSALKLLAVTVLTSLTDRDLAQQGIAMPVTGLVARRAELARQSGFDGVIASGQEAAAIRAQSGGGFLIVTPGIRLGGSATADQERVMTPSHAIAAGADYLVVGRPITEADDPAAAAEHIVEEIAGALA